MLAAAPGVVVGTRDFMNDVLVSDIGHDALNGRDTGNGVHIDHGDGWFTQYSHMMKGSIAVEVGQHVEAGDVLGRNRSRPLHKHRKTAGCGQSDAPLGSEEAQRSLAYTAGGMLQVGFAGEAADYCAVRKGV